MSCLPRPTPDQLTILPILIVITSCFWALSLFWSSATASLATTLALGSSALAYLLHSHGRERSRGDRSRAVVSPRFIQPLAPSQVVLLSGILPKPQSKTILRPFLFSSNTANDAAPSDNSQQTQKPLPQEQQHHQNQGQQHLLEQRNLQVSSDTTTVHPSPRKRSQSTTGASSSLKFENSPLEVIAADSLDVLGNKSDPRIWDYIVVGEGREALNCACDLAQLHPSNRILVVLEQTIQSKVAQRVVQRIRRILVAQAQRLWAHEAYGALSTTERKLPRDADDHRLLQSRDIDYSILPSNVGICSGYYATGILIDKPRQEVLATSPVTKPLKRFSSVGGGQRSVLTVNTAVSTPSRTVGLSLCQHLDSCNTPSCHVLCRSGVVFANERHTLVQSLDATVTPPTSKDEGDRSSFSDRSDDPTQHACMVFSIKMQYARAKTPVSRNRTWNTLATLLSRSYTFLGDIALSASDRSDLDTNPTSQMHLQPVLLHRAYPIHQQGRVSLSEAKDGQESFRLDIYASTESLDAFCPIQIHVNVVTSPVRPIAFGNVDLIRKGEDVLLEGLALARAMAKKANWTCLEEHDCQMIEWVRDEMSIRWSSEHISGQDRWQSVCPGLEGVKRPRRSSTSSNGSVRVKTPTLSPYASRTNSYHGKKRESQLLGHQRNSTLDRLKEVSQTLLERESLSEQKEDHIAAKDTQHSMTRKSSNVSISAVEPVSPQRPGIKGIKTSFGGFSSLNESRSHSLALAEETEDHLGVALSIPSTGSASSPKERLERNGSKTFGEGITAADILGTDDGLAPARPSPPEPRKLSRFSIKSYQLERNKTGLTDNWGLGSLDGAFKPSPSGKNDLLTTPPLVADSSPSFSVSPLSPVPVQSHVQVHDFLAGSGSFADGLVTSPPKPDRIRSQQFGKSLFGAATLDDQTRAVSESSNGTDNSSSSSRRSFGVYSPRKSFSSNPSAFIIANRNISPLDAPLELIPDFLGTSLPKTKTDASSLQGATTAVPATVAALNRALSSQSTGAIKSVHFEDCQVVDHLRRVESDPCTVSLAMTGQEPGEGSSLVKEDEGARRPLLTTNLSIESSRSSSTSSSSSKSKAHTRRSWGQGIGGNDIQGIQGLE